MKIQKEMLHRWKKYCTLYCNAYRKTPKDITRGTEAWNIAHALDIPQEAYHIDNDINDTHIRTALKTIFTNAVFDN